MYHRVMANDERDEIRSASRALREAASAFSRALGQTFAEAGAQAGKEIADELKQATKELNDAAVQMGWDVGEQRRSPKAERTRADLLAAARRVFAEKGYEGASVGDVASAAGYTKGAVYANFGSKEELFLELARQLTAADVALADPSADVDLRALFAVHPADDEATAQMLLALELYVYAIRHPEARADLAPVLARASEGVAAAVHRAGSDEGGEPTRQERDTAFGLVAVHTLAAIFAPLFDDPGETPGIARRLVDRLLAG
jgi:TetR/AcrR family transcriptional regulator, transcriptional repressor of aconitase